MDNDHYGDELTLRLSGIADISALDDDEVLTRFMRDLVTRIGMTVIAGPLVATEGGPPEKAGKSAVVILAESHAAIHTYPHLREIFVNVFSCKPFRETDVLAAFHRLVGDYSVTEYTLRRRGEQWPRDLTAAERLWSARRAA
ncbi:S-adenosylmethionine decarboxylase [Actinoplanes sp. SE50]|uniref:S-adenosylmethionine decarboxylase family protein n=1 Tax=unclassified Actinoplanes TaxID=2626549 RepID=UPI00023ECC23|nr:MULTISPECIES: S-adenosylmethionine decarboxylase [unclassified Actinoplanes]AEV82079.1 S-adenosylmethionine decarboxylase proenzyme [Actinoplanes sp. SE50/110]ATO80478.1 S-adenosylmethionine decarboxylase [Actinoplanes sp. SE50]SLL97885.1 S-adenosylmethionine decarboxylase [Actinoplanes sp. SE50/110]